MRWWWLKMGDGKSKSDRQFELLDERLIDIQGNLKTLIRKVNERMSELSDAVAEIANDVTELQAAQQKVVDMLNKPNPDVAAAVAALQNADAGFDAVRDALNAAVPDAEPTTET